MRELEPRFGGDLDELFPCDVAIDAVAEDQVGEAVVVKVQPAGQRALRLGRHHRHPERLVRHREALAAERFQQRRRPAHRSQRDVEVPVPIEIFHRELEAVALGNLLFGQFPVVGERQAMQLAGFRHLLHQLLRGAAPAIRQDFPRGNHRARVKICIRLDPETNGVLRSERHQHASGSPSFRAQQNLRLPQPLTCGRDPQNAQAQGLDLLHRSQLADQRRNHLTRVRRPPAASCAPNLFDIPLAALLQRSPIRDHRAREFLVKCHSQNPRIAFAQAFQKPLPKSLLDFERDMLGIPNLLLTRRIEHLLRGLIRILRGCRDR